MDAASDADTAKGESSICRKVRCSEEPPIETNAQEMNYRLKLYPDVRKVLKEKIRCTACAAPMLKEVMAGRSLSFHPILQVLVCKDCRGFYGGGDFPLDEDNSDTYCRWCAQGGNLYCCSSCNFVFCKPCIRRNFRQSMLEEIEEEDWNCFVCNPEALWKQRAICWAVREFSKSRPHEPSDSENSDDESTEVRRERSRRKDSKKERGKNVRDDDNQNKRKRRSKRVAESDDSSQERTDEEKKADEKKKVGIKSTAELLKVRMPKVRKDVENDVSPILVDLDAENKKMAVMKKTCLSMENLTKSAQHITNTGNRKMHELHAWISGKNASPRKQLQLSPTKLKKMMATFSKIVHGVKEKAEELERKVLVLEEEWRSVFEEGSTNVEEMVSDEERNVENEDVGKEGERVKSKHVEEIENAEQKEVENEDIGKEGGANVPENINDSIENVNGLDDLSEVENISLKKTIPSGEDECQLEGQERDNVSDAETVDLNHVPSVQDLNEESSKVEGGDDDLKEASITGVGVNLDRDNEEAVKKTENVKEGNALGEKANGAETSKEVSESSEETHGRNSNQSNESTRLNVSNDIFVDEDINPVSSVQPERDEEKVKSVAPIICEDTESEEEDAAKCDEKIKEKHNLCEKSLTEEDDQNQLIDSIGVSTDFETDGDGNEASKDAVKKDADIIKPTDQEDEANKENITPSKDDRDAKLEFLLDSSSSEGSDKKLVNGVRKCRGRELVLPDSTDSSDSDSEVARKKMSNRRRKKGEVPHEKLVVTELVAQFDDEKLKKACSVVVKKLGKSDVSDETTEKKSAKSQRKEKDEMEMAIKRLGNLTSLENPRKTKDTSSNSDSGCDDGKKKLVLKKSESKINKKEQEGDSPEEDHSEAPHVSTDELELELKNVSKHEDTKMDEMAKNMLVENSTDSDSDFYLGDEEKKGKLKSKVKADKRENPKKEKKDSDSDFDGKPSKKSWRNHRLLRAKLSETDSSEEERKWREKKSSLERNRRPRLMSSSSDVKISSGDSSSDSDSDKKKRKRTPKSDSSQSNSSGSKTKKKKKRRRIKLADSNSDSDKKKEDSDIEEVDDKGMKGRKNIRKVLEDNSLGAGAKQAAIHEAERKRRIGERQKLYNEIFVNKKKEATVDKLVLDFDPDTKEELVAVHSDLVKKLTPHQAEGVKFMWDACFESLKIMETEKGSGCILAHCMGLGKTLQVVALIHTLMQNPKTNIKTVLVICPLNTVLNWVNEFEIWLKDVESGSDIEIFELTRLKGNVERMFQLKEWHNDGGVMILGYDMYRVLVTGKKKRKKVQDTFISTLADPGPDLVICDEGHLLKNLQSALSKAVNSIKTSRRIVLTGTPLQNNLKEYHCMIQFVKPNLLGTHKEFLNRFVNPISNGQCADSTPHDVKIMKRRAHVLHKMLDGCVQRRDFSVMIPYLPAKNEYVICICLTELQSKLYSHYLQTYSQRGTGGTKLFNDFQNLQRIWTHPRVMKMSSERQELRQMMKSDGSDSEGSLKDFICDDSAESDTTETSSQSSDDDKTKKRKKLKRNCKDGDYSSSDSSVVACIDDENKKKEGNEGENEKEDPLSLGKKPWWEPFIQPEDHDIITHSGKLMLLFTILKKCEMIGDKVLLFSQSLYSLNLIEYFLEYLDSSRKNSQKLDESVVGEGEESSFHFTGSWEKGIDYFRIDGSVSGENRSMWCKSFNREENLRGRLFLISTRAGGMGINLVGANRVILFDASWNPSNDVQSIYRVYRFGQKKPCYVYRFLAQGTMEEKIYNRQVTKLSLASRVLDEHQIERHYNFDDLQELYSYEPTDMSKRPTPILPKDRLLAELIQNFPNLIYNYHEHDSLLQNIAEEELNEEERKAAWEDFENEKKVKVPENLPIGFGGMQNAASNLFGGIPYPTMTTIIPGLMESLIKKYPNATQEQLAAELRAVNNQLTHYFPDSQQQMYNQLLPENMMQQNMSLYPAMRQQFEQSLMMDPNSYQSYIQSPYFASTANSSSHTAAPSKVSNNPQQYVSTAKGIPPVQLPTTASKDTVKKAPSAAKGIPGPPKIKIRSDLLPVIDVDKDIMIESEIRKE